MSLADWGWDAAWAEAFAPFTGQGLVPARVIAEHQHIYRLAAEQGEALGVAAGRVRHGAERREDFPVVGDWTAIRTPAGAERAVIHTRLPRRSQFARRAAGDETEQQVIAANIDVVFVVTGLDNDFNVRRLERYMAVAWESGARPVVFLNKADLCADVSGREAEARASAPRAAVHAMSAASGEGMDAVSRHLEPGRTGALIGSSGVGKSTIINRLVGHDLQRTAAVRESDQRGRHTTSFRELIRLPDGALIIDTPGMRELQLWARDQGVRDAFSDIEAMAGNCRFADCRHDREPDCAVRRAADEGVLAAARLEHYHALREETERLERDRVERGRIDERRRNRRR